MTRIGRYLAVAALSLAVTGHVGTDDVFFAGEAGPWNVRVSVRQPGVIPGLADITVRVAEPGVERVTVAARAAGPGAGAAPPPDVARPVAGETGLYSTQLWLMVRGPHQVEVTVAGGAGTGVVAIPVEARATRQLEMTRGLEFFVAGGGLFLVIGLLTLVGAAVRESVLPAGQTPARPDLVRARWAMGFAGLVLALLLFGGFTWIRAEAEAHRNRIDRPWTATASIRPADTGIVLDFAISEPLWVNRNDEAWRSRNGRYRRADLIPDHGKMMHMFVIREPALDAFAHIHPERVDDNAFAVSLPPLPAGRYRVYADISHEDGSSRTLQAAVDVPAIVSDPQGKSSAGPAIDVDDAWWSGEVSGSRSVLSDGSVMEWVNGDAPLVAGEEGELQFRVTDADGGRTVLEPYMGMAGHAMLNRSDGGVFIHLHPSGMVPMAAQSALRPAVESSSTGAMMEGMAMARSAGGMAEDVVRFPLIVPSAGEYRVWVQVRKGDQVFTGAFGATVRSR